jgi:hypothetical protein
VLLTRDTGAAVVFVLFVAVGTGAKVSAVGANVGLRVPVGTGARVTIVGARVGRVGVIMLGLRVGTIMLLGAEGMGMIGVGFTIGQCGPDLLEDPPFPFPFPLPLPLAFLPLLLEELQSS